MADFIAQMVQAMHPRRPGPPIPGELLVEGGGDSLPIDGDLGVCLIGHLAKFVDFRGGNTAIDPALLHQVVLRLVGRLQRLDQLAILCMAKQSVVKINTINPEPMHAADGTGQA